MEKIDKTSSNQIMPILNKCFQILKHRFTYIFSGVILFEVFMNVIIKISLLDSGNCYQHLFNIFFSISLIVPLVLLDLYTIFILKDKVQQMINKLSWNLNLLSPAIKNKIVNKSKCGDRIFLCNVLLQLVGASGTCIRDVESIFFPQSAEVLPSFLWTMMICYIMLVIIYFIIIINSTAVFCFYYITVCIETQIIILTDFVKRNLEETLNNALVERHLKHLIGNYQEMISCILHIQKLMYVPMVCASLLTLSFIISYLFMLYLGIVSLFFAYFTAAAVLFLLATMTHQAQLSEDLQNEFCYALYYSKWCEWSLSNMKLFRVFHLIALKSCRWNFTGAGEIYFNHDFFKRIIEIIYTVGNFIRSLPTL